MGEKLKKINWKNVGWRIGQAIIICFFNTASFVYGIGSLVPYETISKNGIDFKLSWIDYLKLSNKVEWYHMFFLYLFIVIGVILSVLFIKLLWKNNQAKKDREIEEKKYDLEMKKIKQQEKAHNDLMKKILKEE